MQFRVGIVGGSGFIGTALAEYLSKESRVRIIDIKAPPKALDNVEFNSCDIRDYNCLKHALEGVDVVIHLAIIQIPEINEKKRLAYEVNILGTHNVCRAVCENERVEGMILASSWHVMGERLEGVINEKYGYHPDKVDDRAKLYVLSKIAQEAIVKFYSEVCDKVYGIIRLGTVLGERMPKKTAANIFIERGLRGESITPYKHSMYRPMLYVDIEDVCKAFKNYIYKILKTNHNKEKSSLAQIVNVFYPEPITILELAEIVRKTIIKHSRGRIQPSIEIVDTGHKLQFTEDDKKKFRVDISKARKFLGLTKMKSPEESINQIVKIRIAKGFNTG